MKKLYIIAFAVFFSLNLAAQSDTIVDHCIGATLTNYSDPNAASGNIGGPSTEADKAKMQRFDVAHGVEDFGSVTALLFNFDNISSTQDSFKITIWEDNGGEPGDVLGETTIFYADANLFGSGTHEGVAWNGGAAFSSPVPIPGNKTFWAGLQYGLSLNGTFAISTTTDGDPFTDAGTHTFSEVVASIPSNRMFDDFASDYNLNVALAIFPVMSLNVGINDGEAQVAQLYQNAPNPFNGTTNIRYQLTEQANVTLEVFDLTGKRVKFFNEGSQTQGLYNVEINSDEMTAGVYFYTLTANNQKVTQKMILTK